MAKMNLNYLSLSELKALQKDLTKAIAEFGDRKKLEAIVALE